MIERLRVFFSGTVQGVGFRYAVLRASQNFDVTGWVRNLSDGRVEVLAEGPRNTLEEFVREIEVKMDGYVTRKMVDWSAARGEFSGFEIVATV